MKLEITQEGYLKLSEIFNPIIIENEQGERISICQRNGVFEVIVLDEMEPSPPRRLLTVHGMSIH